MVSSPVSVAETSYASGTGAALDVDFACLAPDLRSLVVALDRSSRSVLGLAVLWRELALGLCTIRDSFCTDTRCYLVTAPVAGRPCPLDVGHLDVLDAILAGVGQKTIAIERKVAPSTVAAHARAALRHLGLQHRPSQVQPLLMLAARAARAGDATCTGRVSSLEHAGETLRAIAVPRPDVTLASLPPAERSVVRLVVEGMPYSEIAQRRGTSTRTVANQLAAVFRRLRVSGRSELILRLLELSLHPVH